MLNSYRVNRSEPRVSVIIPAYNAEQFIVSTLRSVLAQTYCELEILVVNDGSTDNTATIVDSFAKQDSRIRLINQAHCGVATARNRAIEQARGVFIAPLDGDDLWHPDMLNKLVSCLETADSNVGVVYAWSVGIDEDNKHTGQLINSNIQGDVYKTLVCHYFIGNASATLIRSRCLDSTGKYNTQFYTQDIQGCEDWDLYLRIAENFQFLRVPEYLVGYRKINSSMSSNLRKMAQSQNLAMHFARRRNPEVPAFLFRFSNASFYIYLASKSNDRNPRETLFWLNKSVQSSVSILFCRFEFYALLINNLFVLGRLLVGKSFPFLKRLERENCPVLNKDRLSPIFDRPVGMPLSSKLNLVFSSMLHRALS